MVYTNKQFPNDETQFPPPQRWLTWMAYSMNGQQWDATARKWVAVGPDALVGQVRHHFDLAKAKGYIRGDGEGKFYVTWVIYEWDGQRWVERYSGKRGEVRKDHPLWGVKVAAKDLARDITDEEIEAVRLSILRDT